MHLSTFTPLLVVMGQSPRIAYPKPTTISAGGDVTATVSDPDVRYARRFSLDIAEDALAKLAPDVIPYIVERLAKQIAAEQRGTVEDTVHEYLRNQAWAEPIIRQAIKEAVREYIRGMFEVTRGLA